jgi:hypothetical protein
VGLFYVDDTQDTNGSDSTLDSNDTVNLIGTLQNAGTDNLDADNFI